ncbi:sensor histidine kinase [Enterococcus hulanensis]|uniref:histidine kinase n=1 Tax=Enterococcus hulanensis TaxID=2559929 RepID=A0ABU3F4P6_9ENTE|nr:MULTISPECIES: sensor histidine kinase [Enterococcus]MBX8938073.1 HAMP domain-containing histidine kinase [Enterococcus gilvus]MDT2602109.1 sensor histidine kinase [Enterococcus hulanensis]MDT2608404.1 sensor histidine kinase [Enterococcus hulanensis]MDT2615699.1 sensor histidine kinase [Enterococcus hulanensis]MDT2630181.1 sensor histidine kinase [Enterococcus hulanensis]
MKLVKSFLYERRIIYGMYLVFWGLIFLTFYLYEFSFAPFFDGWLFTAFVLLVYSVVSFYRSFRKQKQLELLATKDLQLSNLVFLPKAATLSEQTYQEVLRLVLENKNQEQEELQQKQLAMLDDFGLWLHQIKTPVAALDLLIQSGQLDPRTMKNEVFKINEYLQMILNYMRQNLDQADLVFQQLSIEKIIKSVVKKYATFFSQKDLSLQLGNLEGRVYSDQKWLIFILEQVIFNAIKYTENGTISISFSDNQLTIQDTGIGIRSEDLPRVFEKGYTGINGREQQRASGLGLYLSQEAAEKLGCRLYIESQVKKGTTVTIVFPEEISAFE